MPIQPLLLLLLISARRFACPLAKLSACPLICRLMDMKRPQLQSCMQAPLLQQAQPTPAASPPAASTVKPKRGKNASRKAYDKRKRQARYVLVKQLLAAAKQSGLKPADAIAAAAAHNPAATTEPASEDDIEAAQAPAAASGSVSASQSAGVHPTAEPGSAGVLARGSGVGGGPTRTATEKRRAYRRKQNLKKRERLAREAADAQAAGHSLRPTGPPAAAGGDAPLTTSQRRRQKKRQREARQAAEDAALGMPFQAPAAATAAAAAARGSVEVIQEQQRHRSGELAANMADATADAVPSADPSVVRVSEGYHLCSLAASLTCSLSIPALTES